VIFLWGGKDVAPLIATPNVDNSNRRQERQKAKLLAMCNLCAERNSICFCKYMDRVLVLGLRKRNGRKGFCSRLFSFFKIPEIQAFAYKMPKLARCCAEKVSAS
jgi:hypothetical protein